MKNKKTILIFAGILLLFSGIVNAQQQVAIIGTNVGKEIKLSINAGFHLSNMIGKGVQKGDNIFISAYSTNDSPDWYECYGLYAGGYNGLLPGYKFGLGITFDMNTFFAWGFDLNFETKGCRIPIKEIITSYYTTITDPFFTSTLEEKKKHCRIKFVF
ncbi:MAG: hypothetical protein LBV02_07705 [Bacteroidales bacterium]|jgi:hypothetical protein|nr:hypothetical protein [Bacteroidales bacterium]